MVKPQTNYMSTIIKPALCKKWNLQNKFIYYYSMSFAERSIRRATDDIHLTMYVVLYIRVQWVRNYLIINPRSNCNKYSICFINSICLWLLASIWLGFYGKNNCSYCYYTTRFFQSAATQPYFVHFKTFLLGRLFVCSNLFTYLLHKNIGNIGIIWKVLIWEEYRDIGPESISGTGSNGRILKMTLNLSHFLRKNV